jgi:hypothetical protein
MLVLLSSPYFVYGTSIGPVPTMSERDIVATPCLHREIQTSVAGSDHINVSLRLRPELQPFVILFDPAPYEGPRNITVIIDFPQDANLLPGIYGASLSATDFVPGQVAVGVSIGFIIRSLGVNASSYNASTCNNTNVTAHGSESSMLTVSLVDGYTNQFAFNQTNKFEFYLRNNGITPVTNVSAIVSLFGQSKRTHPVSLSAWGQSALLEVYFDRTEMLPGSINGTITIRTEDIVPVTTIQSIRVVKENITVINGSIVLPIVDARRETPKVCYGCWYAQNCIDVGTRLDRLYCDTDSQMHTQRQINQSCDNNYECDTNICGNHYCEGPVAPSHDNNVFSRIRRWFITLLGLT